MSTVLTPAEAQAKAAAGTAKGKITTARVVPGMQILVYANGREATGYRDAIPATVERVDRGVKASQFSQRGTTRIVTARGEFFTYPHNTVMLARDKDLAAAAKAQATAAPVESADVAGIVLVHGGQRDATQAADGTIRYTDAAGKNRKASPGIAKTFRKTPDAPAAEPTPAPELGRLTKAHAESERDGALARRYDVGQAVRVKVQTGGRWHSATYVRPSDPGRDASAGFHIVTVDGLESEREIHPQRIRPAVRPVADAPAVAESVNPVKWTKVTAGHYVSDHGWTVRKSSTTAPGSRGGRRESAAYAIPTHLADGIGLASRKGYQPCGNITQAKTYAATQAAASNPADAAPVFTLTASGAAKVAAHTGETVAQVEEAAKAQGWQVESATDAAADHAEVLAELDAVTAWDAANSANAERYERSFIRTETMPKAAARNAVDNFRAMAASAASAAGRAFWTLRADSAAARAGLPL